MEMWPAGRVIKMPRWDKTPRKRGRALQKEREEWFHMHPLCAWPGCISKARELDHIIPLAKGGADTASNKQGLCWTHHKIKTALDFNHKPKVRIGIDGYAISEDDQSGGS